MKNKLKRTKAESILELLLAVSIFSIVIPTLLYVVGTTADRQASRNWYYESLLMLEDVRDVIKQKKTTDWEFFAQDATFIVKRGLSGWEFTQVAEITPPTAQDDLVVVVESEDANRNSDGVLVESGGYSDPATRKITITIDWYGAVTQTRSSIYITRTDNLKSVGVSTKEEYENGGHFDGLLVVTGTPNTPDKLTLGSSAPGPMSGVMSYWSMDGETQSAKSEIDLAEGGTDNLFFEGTPHFVDSLYGKSLVTGKNGDRLYASPSARLDLTGSGSIVVWVKNSTNPASAQTILDKHNNKSGYQIRIIPGGQIEATFESPTESTTARTQKTLVDGVWHMVGFSYNNELLTPYFDGVQSGEPSPGQSSLFPSSGIISIGNDNENATTPFTGFIDDVQLYASALTAENIEDLLYSKYESKSFDMGQSALVHGLSAKVFKPAGAKLEIQMSVQNKLSGVCKKPSNYVGPSGESDAHYSVSQDGESSVVFPFPIGNYPDTEYSNPGECVSFRVRMSSGTSASPELQKPSISNINIQYSL